MIVCLLTTYNRPEMLQQSLPLIERESILINAPLVISDDNSTDTQTLNILEGVKGRCTVVSPPLIGLKSRHEATARNNLFAFKYIFEHFSGVEYVLKCDDDIVMVEGAFKRILAAKYSAEKDGYEVGIISGLNFEAGEKFVRGDGYMIAPNAPFPGVLININDFQHMYYDEELPAIITKGFDLYFLRTVLKSYRPNAVCVWVSPAVIYHAGHHGVHSRRDYNHNYMGSTEGITCT